MKTPIIIALSIAGVLGTAGAAMAVNAGTLASFSQTHLGNAPTVLDPTATPTGHPSDDPTSTATPEPSETAEPGEHSTPEPGDDNGEHSTSPSPSPTHTESGDDHGGDDGGHGSDD
jgi:hypothetical protein